jgi:predicted Zn-dependent peptidase
MSEAMPGIESVALGVWADAGSMDEGPGEFGQAHFLEHMLFKGTETRSAFDLAEAIEDVGGQLNAYTERETTHVFARILAEHLPLAVTLLADMICHSAFAQVELDRERQVVIEEIRKYESLPEERIHDLIMDGLYAGGGLGHQILGTEESVLAFTRANLLTCWQRHFAADRVLITAAGKVNHSALVAQVEEAFAALPLPLGTRLAQPVGTTVRRILEEEDEDQVHFCWGGRTFPATDPRNFALAMIDAALGASTTSRLFQEVREKRGLAYDVASYTMGFRETGLICATGATSPETFPEVLSLVRREVEGMRRQGMTAKELARAKEQMKSGMALSLESTTERMRRLASHQLTWGTVYPLGEMIARMNEVTLDDIQQVLDTVLNSAEWTFTAIGPIDEKLVAEVLGS